MDTPALVRSSIRPGDWASSVDLSDTYFHIGIHPGDRKWMRFVWQGQAFQFRVLPFSLSLSPWIFTMVVRFLVKVARARGIRIFTYLDDWLILASSSQVCRDHTMFVISLARELGFVVNLEKLKLIPSRTFTFLGMTLDTVRWLASLNPERIDALLSLIVRLSSQASASARTLFSLLGMMESMANLLPLGRVHKRPFQRAVAARWSQESTRGMTSCCWVLGFEIRWLNGLD
jgi:hypothetical protein